MKGTFLFLVKTKFFNKNYFYFEIHRRNLKDIEILVGTIKLSSGGMRYKVKEAIKHEEYGDSNVTYDIAAIRVDGPIQFNDKVQPIKYSIEEVDAGKNLQVSGWGLTETDGEVPDNLQVLNVTAITNKECGKRVSTTVHKSILCTSSPVGQGICRVSWIFFQ